MGCLNMIYTWMVDTAGKGRVLGPFNFNYSWMRAWKWFISIKLHDFQCLDKYAVDDDDVGSGMG